MTKNATETILSLDMISTNNNEHNLSLINLQNFTTRLWQLLFESRSSKCFNTLRASLRIYCTWISV